MTANAPSRQIEQHTALVDALGVLTQTDSEPCVGCETANAAPGWLLCLECVAKIDEAMLVDLAKRHGEYERWCARADEALRAMTADDPRFAPALAMFKRRLRIYERITWLGRAVKSA